MVRIFVTADQLRDGQLVIDGTDARHLGGALRMRAGEELVAVTEDGLEHLCTVTEVLPGRLSATVLSTEMSAREPATHVRLAVALLKGDQLERLLEYATELGVSSFQPLLTERSIVRADAARLESKARRWREVIRSGAELGQRGTLPALLPAAGLADAVRDAAVAGLRPYLLYEGKSLRSLGEVDIAGPGACLLVGPEGGWSDAEVEVARGAGAEPVTLGPRIMRPLPAALAAAAVVLHRAGDMQLKEG